MAIPARITGSRAARTIRFDTAQQPYAIETATGQRRSYGPGVPAFVVRAPDFATWARLSVRPYAMAKAFVNGTLQVDGDLLAAIRWWQGEHDGSIRRWPARLLGPLLLESWLQTRRRARQNIEFHYDRSNAFYQQFLDRRMVYSCACFSDPAWSLDEAQRAKLDLICHKLELRAGDRFLDVGCGWGGLVVHAAEQYGARACGCTLSANQFAYLNDLIAARRLAGRATAMNTDYRTVAARFDKIASVGMYEHVGRHRLRTYFETMSRLLRADGLLLNHGIARPETVTDDASTVFLRRHVFPGGELPYLGDVVRAAERAGFELLDLENLRPHYALTCAAWVGRLQAHRAECLELVNAETYRTWLLYLASAAVSFERGDTELYQILLARRGPGAVRRLTRDHFLTV